MITHYIPQWVLRNHGPNTYEGNIFSGIVERRSKTKAGSGVDLWPCHIEEKLMGTHDNTAARVFRYRIYGQWRIKLSEQDRYSLALWLALFLVRVPQTSADIHNIAADKSVVTEMKIDIIREDKSEILRIIQSNNPQQYDHIIQALGQDAGEAWIIHKAEEYIVLGKDKTELDAKAIYHQYVETAPIKEFARLLMSFRWQWLHTNQGFIIGDNPAVRWNQKLKTWNSGLTRDIEVQFPFTTRTCLFLTKGKGNFSDRVQLCTRAQTREFNRRQRLAATSLIFAASERLVRQNITARVS